MFDEWKSQWGWTGFSTQDPKRSQLMARTLVWILNWWSLLARIANLLASMGAWLRAFREGAEQSIGQARCHLGLFGEPRRLLRFVRLTSTGERRFILGKRRGRVEPTRGSGTMAAYGLVLPGWRPTMPCFLLLVILLFPRVALALMWFFSTYLQRAFHGGLVLPVLGFIFLPLTTIVYAWELNSGMPTAGINLLWLLLAVIVDLGGLGGGAHRRSRR